MENKITSGIWFVFIGLILLLHNLDVIDFNFWATLKYWPLLIVIVGINLMVQNRNYGSYIKIGCNVLFLGWIFYVGMVTPSSHWAGNLFNNKDIRIGDLDDSTPLQNEVHALLDSTISESTLEFNGGAGNFHIQSLAGDTLVAATSADQDMGMNIETSRRDNRQQVVINAKPTSKKKKSAQVAIGISAEPLWNLELNYGAANISGDITHVRFKKLEINTGASNMDLTLGSPQEGTAKIAIATGASKIHFRIPKDAAIRVKYSSILSKNSFEDFATNKDGIAKTANYEERNKKFDIELDGAANTFTISRY
ncbi:LiaI-LiaF-like domain-containing protein [Sphingobacterium suaedae]|uniref:LiaI-LiaF-like domain-containing protein n=1 Tax=Sphingobacterium suaedae TaxID=1686402 RepID=A0ABW5KL51_9SPHI